MLKLVSDARNSSPGDLVSGLVGAFRELESAGWFHRPDVAEAEEALAAEFDSFSGPERDEVAQALTQLWDAFSERFNGPEGFLAAGYEDRHAYLRQLETARERMEPYRNSAAAHYYKSTTFMLLYVKAVLRQQSLESRMAEAVNRGRTLAREGRRVQSTQRVHQMVVSFSMRT